MGLFVGSVCITMYTAAPEAFERRLNELNIRTLPLVLATPTMHSIAER